MLLSPKAEIARRMQEALQMNLADETGVIKLGPLQDNPVKLEESIMVREMDPFEVSNPWRDVRYSQLSADEQTFSLADEVGGSEAWMLRGVLEMNLNYSRRKLLRDPAYEDADALRFKIQDIIRQTPWAFGLRVGDTFWTVYHLEVVEIRAIETGGSSAWTWRYAIYYQCPTLATALELA